MEVYLAPKIKKENPLVISRNYQDHHLNGMTKSFTGVAEARRLSSSHKA